MFEEKDLNSGLTSGFSTMTMPLPWCVKISQVPTKKSITKTDYPPYLSEPLWFLALLKIKIMSWRDKDFLTFLTSNKTWHYCEVFWKMIFKTVSGSGTIVSWSSQLHKESILKATAATGVQVSKFCIRRAIPEMKLLRHVFIRFKHIN
jgi:hypothetical protein